MPVRVRGCSLLFALTLCAWALVAMGQAPIRQTPGSSRIVTPIDDAQAVTLTGNLPPLARAEFDQGEANPETQLDWMVLELEPSAAQQAELDALVDAQHDPASPLYQRWLTPQEYGARFGLSAQDLARISAWLQGHGLQIQEIAASNRLIAFSGTAAAVEETFHTAIHRYLVDGVSHLANSEEPQIPAALEGIVGGVVTLNDFRRTSEIAERKMLTNSRDNHRPIRLAGQERQGEVKPLYSSGSTHYLMPADYSTIYDLNPLYTGGTTGVGTSIAIVGRSNINVSDVTAFRTAAGLPANNPSILLVSANPGLVAGDQDESTLDVEWSGAVAPAAAVKLVVGESTGATDGVDLSAQFIVNHTTAPVEIREKYALEPDQAAEIMRGLKTEVAEGVFLSTCNRVEFYLATERSNQAIEAAQKALNEIYRLKGENKKYFYFYEGPQAFLHLFRVASSLDSMVLGETQILGQVKDAYESSKEKGMTGT